MAHRQKHRRAAELRRAGFIVDEPFGLDLGGDLAAMDDAVADSVRQPRQPTAYEEAILLGLQQKTHVYQGAVAQTVRPRTSRGPVGVAEPFEIYDVVTTGRRLTDDVIARRRSRNRIAKRSRKINRPRRKRTNFAPLAWLAVFSMFFGGVLYYSAPANALMIVAPLRVNATWIGGDCWSRTATHPSDVDGWRTSPGYVAGCNDATTEWQNVVPGQYFGIDPNIGDAYAVACTVTNIATGRIVATDYARNGDGHDANCLGRWTR